MGNNGEIFTNDAGQSISYPEGYATTSEITLTREIFGDLAQFFPERFIPKIILMYLKALNFSKIKRNLYIN